MKKAILSAKINPISAKATEKNKMINREVEITARSCDGCCSYSATYLVMPLNIPAPAITDKTVNNVM